MSVHPSVCPKPNFVESINVTNESCHICISDDKNVFGVITQPSGDTGHLWGPGQEDYPKVGQMKKKLLSSFNTPPVMLPCSYGWSFARMYPPSIYENINFFRNELLYFYYYAFFHQQKLSDWVYLQTMKIEKQFSPCNAEKLKERTIRNPNPKEPQGTLRNPSEH